jgi:hypothetical protein
MHCTVVISAHFMHLLERVYAEPLLEVQKEQDRCSTSIKLRGD